MSATYSPGRLHPDDHPCKLCPPVRRVTGSQLVGVEHPTPVDHSKPMVVENARIVATTPATPTPKFKVGDRVVVARPEYSAPGKRATVTHLSMSSSSTVVHLIGDDGREYGYYAHKLDLLPPEPEPATMFKKGDRAKAVANTQPRHYLHIGTVVEVQSDQPPHARARVTVLGTDSMRHGLKPRLQHVNPGDLEHLPPRPFKPGDRVRVVDASDYGHIMSNGDLGEVRVDRTHFLTVDLDKGKAVTAFARRFELTDEPKPPKFKVGDYVRVLKSGWLGHSLKIGSFGEVTAVTGQTYSGQEYVQVYAPRSTGSRSISQSVHLADLEHAERPPVPLEPYAYVKGQEALDALPNGSVVQATPEFSSVVREKRNGLWCSMISMPKLSGAQLSRYEYLLLHHG